VLSEPDSTVIQHCTVPVVNASNVRIIQYSTVLVVQQGRTGSRWGGTEVVAQSAARSYCVTNSTVVYSTVLIGYCTVLIDYCDVLAYQVQRGAVEGGAEVVGLVDLPVLAVLESVA